MSKGLVAQGMISALALGMVLTIAVGSAVAQTAGGGGGNGTGGGGGNGTGGGNRDGTGGANRVARQIVVEQANQAGAVVTQDAVAQPLTQVVPAVPVQADTLSQKVEATVVQPRAVIVTQPVPKKLVVIKKQKPVVYAIENGGYVTYEPAPQNDYSSSYGYDNSAGYADDSCH